MVAISILFFLISIISFSYAFPGDWPRPDSLTAFWPFDSETQLKDIANNRHLWLTSGKLMDNAAGPFGKTGASYSVDCKNCYIGQRRDNDVTLAPAFTISFFYYTSAIGRGAIFSYYGSYWPFQRFSLNYLEPDQLEFWGGPRDDVLIGRIPGLIKPNTWNFFAVTYDKATENMTIFDRNGSSLATIHTSAILTNTSNSIFAGYNNWGSGWNGMNMTDVLACLMIYEETLSETEIAQLPGVCETKGGVTLPPETTSTTVTVTSRPKTQTTTHPTTTPAITTPPPTTPSTTYAPPGDWPRPNALVGFWPFDSDTKLQDIANGRHLWLTFGRLMTKITGPFGRIWSSYSVECDNCYIAQRVGHDIALAHTFTISFFYYTTAIGRGAILSIDGSYYPFRRFAINYLEPDLLEFWGGPKDDVLIARAPGLVTANSWNFFAVTYDRSSAILRIFDRNGTTLGFVYTSSIPTNTTNSMYAGYNNWGSGWNGMNMTDALACVMVYKEVLSPGDIAQLPGVCERKGASTTAPSSTSPAEPTTAPKTTLTSTRPTSTTALASTMQLSLLLFLNLISLHIFI